LRDGIEAKGASPVEEDGEKAFERLIAEMRPKLHRYCARMTGSVIEGEDVLQEALLKAIEAFPMAQPLSNPEGWLFRIAHNAAQDFLRRRARRAKSHADEDLEAIAAPADPVADRQAAAASLRTFMRLPAAQRSSVILRDVLGYSVEETSEVMGGSIAVIKGALQRGRTRLRELAQEPEDVVPPALAAPERARLLAYIERFNARDFDALRNMLADDVRLELVNRLRLQGRGEVREYFHRYSLVAPWRCVPGFVDGRAAVLMFDQNDLGGRPVFFVLLEWHDEEVAAIRDFLFARYAIEEAQVLVLE